jgi:hypothetical protein
MRGQLQAQAGVNEKCAPAQMWGEEHASADEEHTPAQTLMWSRARSTEVNTNISSFYKSELLAPPVPTDISQNCCHLGIVCMLDDLLLKCTCELDQICGVPLGLCCKHGRAWKSPSAKPEGSGALVWSCCSGRKKIGCSNVNL